VTLAETALAPECEARITLSNRALNVGGAPFSCPGSLVRIAVDPSQPLALAFGMPKDAIAFVSAARLSTLTWRRIYNRGGREARVTARFAAKDLPASGYVNGEKVCWASRRWWMRVSAPETWCSARSPRSSGDSRPALSSFR